MLNKENFKKLFQNSIYYLSIIFIFSLFIIKIFNKQIDSDIYHYLKNGKEILLNGIPKYNWHFILDGYKIILQEWLYDVILYKIYDLFGFLGISIICLITFFIITFLIFKILKKYYTKNLLLINLVVILLPLVCIFSIRAQFISVGLLLIIFLILDTKYFKYLFPICLLISINCHASFWPFLYFIQLPYLINLFILNRKRFFNRFYYLCCSLIILLLNPYTYHNILYIYYSILSRINKINILELQQYKLFYFYTILLIISIFIFIFNFKVLNIKTKIGSILFLFISTLCIRNFIFLSFYWLFFLTDDNISIVLKEKYNKINRKELFHFTKNILIKSILIICISIIIIFSFTKIITQKELSNNNSHKKIIKLLNENNIENVFTTFNTGNYLEFYGFKTYFDANPELYSKYINKKEDVLKEYIRLNNTYYSNLDKYMDKYNCTYIVSDNILLKEILNRDNNYKIVLKDNDWYVFKRIKN